MTAYCTICVEIFTKTDDIFLTAQCGHLFHKKCLQRWLLKNETCPKCRHPCKKPTQRIFLDFLSVENAEKSKIKKLKTELQNTNDNLAELQAINLSLQNLPESRARFDADQLQEQLQIALHDLESAQKEIKSLKEKKCEMKTKSNDGDNKDNSMEKQLKFIQMDKEMIEEDYKKARLEIIQLRCQIREFEMQSKLSNFNKPIENVCDKFRNQNSLTTEKEFNNKSSDDESEDGAKCLTVINETNKNYNGNPFVYDISSNPFKFNDYHHKYYSDKDGNSN